MASLFDEYQLKGVTLRNRVAVSPMCQYSSDDGFPNDWHFVHLGSRAVGGAGLVIVEATAVTPEGRISPADSGIYHDAHVEPFAKIAKFLTAIDNKITAIQTKLEAVKQYKRGLLQQMFV